MVFETLIKDPQVKQNFIFLTVGIMIGVLLCIIWKFINDSPERAVKEGKVAGEESGSDWEDEESDDEDTSNANEEQSPEKDKALSEQYPIDDVKMMLAVRTDLGMTKGKIGA